MKIKIKFYKKLVMSVFKTLWKFLNFKTKFKKDPKETVSHYEKNSEKKWTRLNVIKKIYLYIQNLRSIFFHHIFKGS